MFITELIKFAPRKNNQLVYIEYFRGATILLIVGGHVFSTLGQKFSPVVRELLEAILTGGTLMFVFIAGYLFQYLSHKFEYKSYLKKKILNVTVPYFVASLVIMLSKLLLSKNQLPEGNFWVNYLLALLNGSASTPLWFVPMISIFYLISPLFIWFDRKNLYRHLIWLVLVMFFVYRGNNLMILQNTIYFMPVYVIGMYASRNREQLKEFFADKFYIVLVAMMLFYGLALLFFNSDYQIFKLGRVTVDLSVLDQTVLLTCAKFTTCIFAVLLFMRCEAKILSSKFGDFTLRALAMYSFGVFFYHENFLLLYTRFLQDRVNIDNDFIGVIFLLFGTISVTLATTFALAVAKKILNKLKITKTRFLLGC